MGEAKAADSDARADRWVAAELCRRLLLEIADDLAPIGVQLLAFKGIHIAYCVAPHASDRPLGDADALVVRGDFGRAIDRLRTKSRAEPARGWVLREDDWSAVMLQDTVRGAAVDLHRSAYPPFFPALHPSTLRRDARAEPLHFGRHVLVPSDVDAAAIAIANHVKDRVGVFGLAGLANDLAWLADRRGVTAAALAARAPALGLRRICAVGLTAIARDDARWWSWVDACTTSALERRWARAEVDALRWLTRRSDMAGFVAFRAIADDVRAIPKSLVLGAAARLPWRIARAVRGSDETADERRARSPDDGAPASKQERG